MAGASWSLLAGAGPTRRNGHALTCDLDRGRVVLFGGFRDARDLDDTWEWDGTRWERVGP